MDGMILILLIPTLFMLLLPIALLVFLQVWLCKKGRWLGLILPGLSLALSLLMVLSISAYSHPTGGGAAGPGQPAAAQGSDTVRQYVLDKGTVIAAASVFLVTNIPTAVYGGIWLHYKGQRDMLEDFKRMQIEDLE